MDSARRRVLRERAVALLGGKCQICGYDRCPAAMDFHHLDPSEKDFSISESTDWDNIERELKKCVLLCATCHREVHDGLHPTFLMQSDDVWNRWLDEDVIIQPELI
jgi:predicted HNH restriction endonuclease